MTRRRKTFLAGGLGALVLLIIIAFGLFPQEILRRHIETRLQDGLGPGSSVRRMRVVPGRLRTEVEDLVIEGPTYRLTVPRARLVLSPAFLWGHSLAFNSIEMQSPTLEVRPAAADRPYKPLRKPLLIRRIDVQGGTVTYQIPEQGQLVIQGLIMQGSVGQGSLDVASTGGTWQRATPIALGPSRGRLQVSSALDLKVETLDSVVLSSRFTVAGILGQVGNLNPDLTFKGWIDLADLERAGLLSGLRGRGTAEARLVGLGADLKLEAKAGGERIEFQQWPIDRAEVRVKQAGTSEGRTDLELEAALLGGRAEGNVEILKIQTVQGKFKLASIDIGRLRRQGIGLDAVPQGRVSGTGSFRGPIDGPFRIDAQLEASGQGPQGPVEATIRTSGSALPRTRSLDLQYTADLAAPRPFPADGPPLRDVRVTVRGRAHGTMPPIIEGTFEGSASLVRDGSVERVPLEGRFRNARGATTFAAEARALGGTLKASGDLRGDVARRLEIEGSNVEVGLFNAQAQGRGSFRFQASGPLDRLSGTGTAQVQDLVWAGGRMGAVDVQLHGNRGRGTFTVTLPELNAAGQGSFDRRTVSAVLTLDRSPLDRLQPLLGPGTSVAGQASGTVEVSFPFAHPRAATATAHLSGVELLMDGRTIRAARPFEATLRSRRLSVKGLQLASEGISLRATGSLGLDPAGTLDGTVAFDADVSRVPVPAPWTLTGTAKGEVALSGTRTRPRAHGLVTLAGVTARHPRSAPIEVSDAEIELVGEEALIRSLHASLPGGTFDLSGRVPLAALVSDPMAQRLGLPPGKSAELRAVFNVDLAQVPHPVGWTLAGQAQGDVVLSGTLAQPRAFGTVTMTGATVQPPKGTLLAVAEGRIDLMGDHAMIPGIRATLAEGTLQLSGRVPIAALLPEARARQIGLAPGEEADLLVTWEGVQAAALLEALRPDRPSRISASLAGEARLRGTLTSWRNAHGEGRLVPTAVRVQDLDLEVLPITARVEAGRVTIDGVVVKIAGTTFRADGKMDLATGVFQATGQGALELRALSPFLDEASLTGMAEIDVRAEGTLKEPRAQGTVRVRDATLRIRDIRQPLTGVTALVVLEGTTVRIQEAHGVLGGGTLAMEGSARLAGTALEDVKVSLKGDDIGLRYPVGQRGSRARAVLEELKARLDVDLTLTGRTGDFLLAGVLNAERTLYDTDIFLEEGLLAPEIPPETSQDKSPFLQLIALNIAVATENPFLIRNNLAQLEAEGGLWVRGSADAPSPFGRFELRPGGKVFLQGREFSVESGSLVYTGTLNPDISVRAVALLSQPDGNIEVTVAADGPLDTPRLTLRSSPPLSEGEIASLIATGRANVALNSSAWVVGEQAAALLAGRFTRKVARELLDLGLDQVDIQPEILSREGELSARFTFAKQLTRNLRLIYSTSLSDPESQYYQALLQLRPGRELSLKAQRRFDGSFTYGAGQRLRFGGPPRRAAREFEPTVLQEVRLEGDLREFPDLVGRIKARRGRKVSFFDLLDDADRLRDHFVQQGYLEAVIETRLVNDVALFDASLGPRFRWRVEGMATPPDLTAEIRKALFEEEALERGRERLLGELHRRGHYRGAVETQTVREGGERTLLFEVEPGPVLTADVSFPGATALSHRALMDAAGGPATIVTRPKDAEEGIRAAYRAAHYLTTKVGPIRTADHPGRVEAVIPIEEGPAATVAALRFPGATLPEAELAELAGISPGSQYDALATSDAVLKLRDRYLSLGYMAVRVRPTVVPVGQDLEIHFQVAEGHPVVVGPIEIVGLRRTRESLVRGVVELDPGEPLDPRKLAVLERRLQDLGIFRHVAVTATAESPATVRIEVEEEAPYQAAYDLRYNTDEGASALVDGEVKNVFGRGLALGARFRAGRVVREVRGSFHLPSIWGPGDLSGAVYHLAENVKTTREEVPGALAPRGFAGRRTEQGFQIQEALHGFHPWELLYGYRFKRITCPTQGLPPRSRNRRRRIFDPCEVPNSALLAMAPPPFPKLHVGGVDLSTIRETRDNPLDPTRGSFLSANLQLSPKTLGSDFNFIREFVQASFVHDFRRTLVLAHGYRIGLVHTFGGERLPFDELFKAGGPNSLRGFGIDAVGPRGPEGEALGGEAVFIVNQELRYHHPTGLGAAVFYDGGNVFAKLRDFAFKLRHSIGVGLRYDSVVGLLRVDLAFPLGDRDDGKTYRIYFGLGQAF